MERIYPRKITDRTELSKLLELHLNALIHSPYEVTLKNLAWDTQIPERIWERLIAYQHTPSDATVVTAEDFHIAFAHIMVHYPAVRLWREADGSVYVSI